MDDEVKVTKKFKLDQTKVNVNAIIAGFTAACGYDENTGLYFPLPPEVLAYVEQFQPGLIQDADMSVTVAANTTTASSEKEADTGNVFYVNSVTIGGTPPSGTITVEIDGTPVIQGKALSATTIDLASANGGKPFRGKKITITVTLSSAPTAATTVDITVNLVQKKDLTAT